MKTATFPAVVEARKAASGQLTFYKTMMTDAKKPVKAPNASKPGTETTKKKTSGK